jgi:hypothetical protein
MNATPGFPLQLTTTWLRASPVVLRASAPAGVLSLLVVLSVNASKRMSVLVVPRLGQERISTLRGIAEESTGSDSRLTAFQPSARVQTIRGRALRQVKKAAPETPNYSQSNEQH